MADTEGIRSSFSTQLIPRSPKLRIYEKYGQHFRPQSIFALPEPLVPPMMLLLPPFAAARNR
jgi:hypothetical protein